MSASLDPLLKQTCEWLKGSGPHSDIVMTSRVRLAGLTSLNFHNNLFS